MKQVFESNGPLLGIREISRLDILLTLLEYRVEDKLEDLLFELQICTKCF